MQRVEHTGSNAAANGCSVKAQPGQLGTGNHPVLPAGERNNSMVPAGWSVSGAFFATESYHPARVARGVLRVRALCDGSARPGTG
jgi:hypothetical protein